MASSESVADQLRASSVLPLILGLMGPGGSDSERVVLVNSVTQSMIVLRGDAGAIMEMLSSGAGAGSGGVGSPPASKASIEAMRSVGQAELREKEECPVCLEALLRIDDDGTKEEAATEAEVREMPCGHRYHGGCIGKWLRAHGSCPLCRFQMPAEEEEEAKKEIEDWGEEGSEEGEEGEQRDRRRRRVQGEIWVTIAIRRGGDDGGEDDDDDNDGGLEQQTEEQEQAAEAEGERGEEEEAC